MNGLAILWIYLNFKLCVMVAGGKTTHIAILMKDQVDAC